VAQALELPVEERAACLAALCPDSAQRSLAERLLRACERAATSPIFDAPATIFAAPILAEMREHERAIPEPLRIALEGRYTIERELGRGGQATVYLARDERHGRLVALKVLHPAMVGDDGPWQNALRFQREIEFAARLSHPHILPLYDSGAVAGRLYYVTPYVDGESLRDRLRRTGRLPLPETLRVLRDVARALSHAHRQGLVHRDIKPANILITREGDALVSDFGVAKALAEAASPADAPDAELTGGALVLGTPAYMAPEQATGGPEVDPRADLYSFGVVAYELLIGATPFAGRERHEVLAAHISEPPPPLDAGANDLPAALATLVDRLLAKRPADRPRDAEEVLEWLDLVISNPMASASSARLTGRRPWYLGSGRALRLAGVVTVVMTASVLIAAWSRRLGDAGAEAPSIAVLPFANTRGTLDDAAFSDGLTDELTGALSRVPGLEVAARQAATALARQGVGVATIGERLGVATVLEGRVLRDGERLEVTTNLVATRDRRIVWSETYDVSSRDVFAVQERIARDVVTALSPRLTGSPPAGTLVERGTDNVEAYQLYLKGRFLFNTRQRDGLSAALQHFTNAVALDSTYARAYAAIAEVHTLQGIFGYERPREASPKARAAATRAIALDSLLGEAYAALAHQLFVYEWNWSAAEPALERAIALSPRYPTARMYYASYLHSVGRPEEALAQLNAAREIDPITATGVLSGRVYVDTRRPDAAIRVLQEEVELDPRRDLAHQLLAHAYLQKGLHAAALASMRSAAALSGPRDSAQLAYIHAATGDDAEARRILERLVGSRPGLEMLGFHIAMAYAGLGEADEAFRWLESSYAEHGGFMNLLAVTTGFESVRSDPRFADLLRRMRLPMPSRPRS
jgi:serine/threonine-protein kinase